jgi:hypothetical protein
MESISVEEVEVEVEETEGPAVVVKRPMSREVRFGFVWM